MSELLKNRREFFFAYDIRMGNPNGDPDGNRPRQLPDGTFYATDVRLKRFVRDFLKSQGQEILVDTIEDKTTNLTGRVGHYLDKIHKKEANGAELVDILLNAFIDARLFGSTFAFKDEKEKATDDVENNEQPLDKGKEKKEKLKAPKTLTGATQISMGEVLHNAEPVDIHGTSIFGSQEEKTRGTFTQFYGLRYALIGFNGIANEHSAKLSKMTEDDYQTLLKALWKSIRSAGNTRSKMGQVPRLLISIEYKPKSEFQFGNLLDYIKPVAANGKEERFWSGPDDYKIDLTLLKKRLKDFSNKIESVSYDISPDIRFTDQNAIESNWKKLNLDA